MGLQVSVAGRGSQGPVTPIPPGTAETICGLLSNLLGRKVTSAKAAPLPLGRRGPRITAVYMENEDTVISICVCDLALAAYAGAALLMVPVGTAKECIYSGKCSAELLENVAEILNICRQCFESPGHHVCAEQLYATPESVPAPIAAVIATPHHRLDLEITIAGYGSGRLSIVI